MREKHDNECKDSEKNDTLSRIMENSMDYREILFLVVIRPYLIFFSLQEKLHARLLEQIFIEERLYKQIEEETSYKAVIPSTS